MRDELIQIYELLMKVNVCGESIDPMYKALVRLTTMISDLPEGEESNEVSDSE